MAVSLLINEDILHGKEVVVTDYELIMIFLPVIGLILLRNEK